MKTMKNTLMGLVVASAAIMTTVNANPGAALRAPAAGTAFEMGLVAKLEAMKGMEPVLQAVRAQSKTLNLTNAGEVSTFLKGISTSIPGLSKEVQAQLTSESFLSEVTANANASVSSTSDYMPGTEESAADVFGAAASVQNTEQCELAEIGSNKKPLTAEQREQAAAVAAKLDAYVQTLVVAGKLSAKDVPAFREKIRALYGVGNSAATQDGSVTEEEAAQLSAGLAILTDSLVDAAAARAALDGDYAVDCALFDAYKTASSGKGKSADALTASAASFVGACGATFGGGKLTAENAAQVCAR